MIILPDRNIPRAKFLMPVFDKEWRTPSLTLPKDQMGNDVVCVKFRIDAKSNDGIVIWSGWFDDRADFDAFLWAIVNGSLNQERALWDLPTPNWQPYLGELITYEFATSVFLTATGSQTYTFPTDYNNANNTIQTLGAGGSGAVGVFYNFTFYTNNAGGGGGAWNRSLNVSKPGATCTYQIGAGGTAVTAPTNSGKNGNAGGDTWFNGSTLAGSSVGSKGGGGGATASGGSGSLAAGGAGGVGSSGVGSSSNNGGAGGSAQTSAVSGPVGAGGGGAAGSTGAGNAGVTTTSAGVVQTNGGSADNGGTGAGTAGTAGGGAGGNGTEWSASYGSGGGGGGRQLPASTAGSAGNGGNYGGGGGGCGGYNTTGATSGAGIQGLIYISYTPIIPAGFNMPNLGM